ncbi:hypothetical protein LCGC14_0405440 [marine sediment metagenome]|uniref:Rad52/22 double-strand break repair protein n=1 Tax=marine sediment metagenome TaxID=412755 RepID=A0A0F9SVG7_9ZZZZ
MYRFPEEGTVEYDFQKPFREEEIGWRPQSTGVKRDKDGEDKPWVMCLAYVQARSVQSRLEEVLGFDGWETEYRNVPGGVMCKLTSHKDGRTASKEDGSPDESDIEPFKSAITGSFKRVASSGFGIGRYLYSLDTAFASQCSFSSQSGYEFHKGKPGEKSIWWLPPKLPSWAIPQSFRGGSNCTINSDSSKPKDYQMKPAAYCEDCKAGITDKVKSYSLEKHKKILCMNCQKKETSVPYSGAIKTLPKKGVNKNECVDCKEVVTDDVRDTSLIHYKGVFCYDCQEKKPLRQVIQQWELEPKENPVYPV